MAADRPITPEQAAVAAKAAGLDLDRPLSEQLKGDQNGDLEREVADLRERVETLSEALAAQRQSAPVTEQNVGQTIMDGINQGRPRARGCRWVRSPRRARDTMPPSKSTHAELDELRQQAADGRVNARDLEAQLEAAKPTSHLFSAL